MFLTNSANSAALGTCRFCILQTIQTSHTADLTYRLEFLPSPQLSNFVDLYSCRSCALQTLQINHFESSASFSSCKTRTICPAQILRLAHSTLCRLCVLGMLDISYLADKTFCCIIFTYHSVRFLLFAPQISEQFNKSVVRCIIIGAIAIYAIVAVLG